MQYLFVASGSITVFILTLIFGKKEKSKSDFILCFILTIILLNFVTLFLLNVGNTPFTKWEEFIFEFSEASIFLYGPLLWLYTKSLTKAGFTIERNHILHFIPFMVAFGYFLIGVLTPLGVAVQIRNVLLVLKLSSIALYVIMSLKLLDGHEKKIQYLFSNIDRKKLTWLRFLCRSILVIGLIAALSLMVDRFTALSIPQYGGMLTNIALCIFVYALGYFGFKQEFIFQPSRTPSGEIVKYAKSGLDQASSKKGYQKLEDYIIKEKSYLDADLTLFGLAEELDLQPNHLSQIINTFSGSNFYDFINQYRVEEAKQRISSDEVLKKTLLGIGLSSGFSSKTTFNRAFKKHTGQTPSECENLQSS